jgi:hypothetical protein
LDERIGLLDGVVTTVWALGDKSSGKYARLVQRFEAWAEGARAAVASRRSLGRRGGGEEEAVVFVSDLDAAGWKADCEGLIRKLGECRDVLRVLGHVDRDSSLATVLRGMEVLVADMLAELDLMLIILHEALASENEWVRAAVNGQGDGEDNTPRAGAIWRAF